MILRFIVTLVGLFLIPPILFGQPLHVAGNNADTAAITVAKDSANLVIVHDINFTGNKRTKSKIVTREIALQKGMAYSREEFTTLMRLTREQLMNTALFVDVITDTFLLGGNELDVNITLKERWYLWPSPYFRTIDRNWNVWINEYGANLSRADIGVKVAHDNVTGNNDKLNFWAIGGYTQRLSFNYFKPYFDRKLRFGYNFAFAYSRNREVNYATEDNKQVFLNTPKFSRKYIKAEAGLSYRKGSTLRMQMRVIYNYENVDSQVVQLNPNYFGDGRTKTNFVDLHYNMQYYKVDYIPYPLRGWYVDAYMINRIGGHSKMNMIQIGGKFLGTWEVMKKTYVAFQAAGLLRFPSNTSYYNSRLLGYGDIYMQGLEYYVADGTAGGMIRTTLRREVLKLTWHQNIIKSKTHNIIPFRFYVKVFGNLGYVYNKNPGSSIMNNKLLKTGGFGLDIVSIYDFALKLDFTYNQFDNGGKLYLHTQSDF